MRMALFWIAAARSRPRSSCVLTRVFFTNDYLFFAGYTVLQYIVLATAWNILGGYTGYINFGTGAFFAIGAYSSVFCTSRRC
jgi:ABC-type branched-subunit amino acid transport system permease subunit